MKKDNQILSLENEYYFSYTCLNKWEEEEKSDLKNFQFYIDSAIKWQKIQSCWHFWIP
mgnify:CR=1 FL=1